MLRPFWKIVALGADLTRVQKPQCVRASKGTCGASACAAGAESPTIGLPPFHALGVPASARGEDGDQAHDRAPSPVVPRGLLGTEAPKRARRALCRRTLRSMPVVRARLGDRVPPPPSRDAPSCPGPSSIPASSCLTERLSWSAQLARDSRVAQEARFREGFPPPRWRHTAAHTPGRLQQRPSSGHWAEGPPVDCARFC